MYIKYNVMIFHMILLYFASHFHYETFGLEPANINQFLKLKALLLNMHPVLIFLLCFVDFM